MKILITGNMGYVGPGVVSLLRTKYPDATLIGYDIGYFGSCLTNASFLPESYLDLQIFGDVRKIDDRLLEGIDSVVSLAAISNDPMGKTYEEITYDVNYKATIELARKAKKAGAKSFVFASSCSMYGAGGDKPKTEDSSLNPLTAYAISKVKSETDLKEFADKDFTITCLRFATACGMSNRLRLDLVVNDFVAGAVVSKKITILSDGTPWRPLINVKDMARAIDWAIFREGSNGGDYLAINTGSNEWNYQVKELAEEIAKVIPGIDVSINKDAEPDKRSYRVNFDMFKKLAPDHQPIYDLETTVFELKEGLEKINMQDKDYRNSDYIRLKVLSRLQAEEMLNSHLEWARKKEVLYFNQ
jgi:nucleoside-diphosphate-sugar epimerase